MTIRGIGSFIALLAVSGCAKTRRVDANEAPPAVLEERVVQYQSAGQTLSARVYLPPGAHTIVAVAHGTNGVGAACGPTHVREVVDYLARPLVEHGYAVVAPDYPPDSYGIGDAEARSILDAIPATRALDASLDGGFFVLGHSQGGQAALFADQRYRPGGATLLGTIAIAPGLGDLAGVEQLFGDPAHALDQTAIFLTMIFWSAQAATDPTTWLTADGARELPAMLHDLCWVELAQRLPARFPTQGDLFAPGFLADTAAWKAILAANVPGAFASDAPILLVQGDRDVIVPPATTAAVARRLAASGTTGVTARNYPDADHYTIVETAMPDILDWMAAITRARAPGTETTSMR